MRLLIDENVPNSVTEFFRERGHVVCLVREVLLPGTADAVIAQVAAMEDMIVVTWNTRDFRPLADRAPAGTKAKIRRFGLICFKCAENLGLERLRRVIRQIELEHSLIQEEGEGRRLIVEISTTTLRFTS
jgi:predicted nuclease of predicted toxin-antitoxin system